MGKANYECLEVQKLKGTLDALSDDGDKLIPHSSLENVDTKPEER